MKKIIFILITLVAFNLQAQKKSPHQNSDLTPEQRAVLRTKQMTLELDLSDQQQNEVLALNQKTSENIGKARGKMNELSKEERYKLKNDMLDKRIAFQRELKTILNAEQYETWKKHASKRMNKMKEKRRNSK